MGPKAKKAAKKPVKEEEDSLKLEIFSSVTLPNGLVLYDLTSPTFEKDLLLQQKEHVDNFNEKKAKEELDIDRKRRDIRMKMKEVSSTSKGKATKYEPLEPIKKSDKLKELEKSIRRGTFLSDHKKYLNEDYPQQFYWNRRHEYRNTFDSVGIIRHRIWKPVV